MRFAVVIRGVSVKGDGQMVAVSDAGLSLPADVPVPGDAAAPVAAGRRVVAIAVTAMELLRPGSDLVRLMAGADRVDLLLACEDAPIADPGPLGVLGGDAQAAAVADDGGYTDDDETDDDTDDADDGLRGAVALPGLGEVHVHRLALRPPLGVAEEGDLVAALSELVGFDPEPGVHCLAPAGGPERSAVEGAVRQIVQVYGLSLQRYRCLELSVVDVN
jgi:hypothetical protein